MAYHMKDITPDGILQGLTEECKRYVKERENDLVRFRSMLNHIYLLRHYPSFEDYSPDILKIWWSTIDPFKMYIDIPWIPKLFDEICLKFTQLGWLYDRDHKATYEGMGPDYYAMYFYPLGEEGGGHLDNLQAIIKMVSSREESVCQLIQVGTQVKEIPIYDVRCQEDQTIEDI